MKLIIKNINKMKTQFLTTLLVLAMGFSTYAQNTSIFNKFEEYNDVTTVVVTKKAFEMLSKIANDSKEGKEFNNLVSGLEDLKVFTTENTKIASEMTATFNKHIKSNKLSELMRVKDKDAHVRIYIREGKDADHVSEFLMLVDEMNIQSKHKGSKRGTPEVVIISLTGDIDLNNISKLTEKMNISGGKHLKKAEKK